MSYKMVILILMFAFLVNPLLAYEQGSGKTDITKQSEKGMDTFKDRIAKLCNGSILDDEITRKIQQLSDTDREYFMAHPERLQVAGSGITTEEFILGFLFLAATVTTIVILGNSNSWGR